MHTSWVRYVVLALLLCTGGFMLLMHGKQIKERHQELESALALYERSTTAMDEGRLEEAQKHFDALKEMTEAHADDPEWRDMRIAALEQGCLLPYAKAEKLYLDYKEVYMTQSAKTLPDRNVVSTAFDEFVKSCSALIGRDGFTDPKVAWRLEHNIATGIVWQMVVRQVMFDAKLQDLKPLYDVSLEHYKKSAKLAEQVRGPDNEIANPVAYVSQSIDFMTRSPQLLNKQKEQQQEQQQDKEKKSGQGLGDFLEKAEKEDAGKQEGEGLGSILDRPQEKRPGEGKFFPSPFKSLGAGKDRLPNRGHK